MHDCPVSRYWYTKYSFCVSVIEIDNTSKKINSITKYRTHNLLIVIRVYFEKHSIVLHLTASGDVVLIPSINYWKRWQSPHLISIRRTKLKAWTMYTYSPLHKHVNTHTHTHWQKVKKNVLFKWNKPIWSHTQISFDECTQTNFKSIPSYYIHLKVNGFFLYFSRNWLSWMNPGITEKNRHEKTAKKNYRLTQSVSIDLLSSWELTEFPVCSFEGEEKKKKNRTDSHTLSKWMSKSKRVWLKRL